MSFAAVAMVHHLTAKSLRYSLSVVKIRPIAFGKTSPSGKRRGSVRGVEYMSSRLITYCSGGLANRIRPLISHIALANALGREHVFVWIADRTCDAKPSDLFSHPGTHNITETQVKQIKGGEVFARDSSIEGVKELHPDLAKTLVNQNRVLPLSYDKIKKSTASDVLVLDNQPYETQASRYLQELRNLNLITQHDDSLAEVITGGLGLHIRLTDFRQVEKVSKQFLVRAISNGINTSEARRYRIRERPVYCATDEEEGVKIAKKCFDQVLSGDEKIYVSEFKADQGWKRNCYRGPDAMQAAVRDLYWLAQCSMRMGLPKSTFFQLAREISAAHKHSKRILLAEFTNYNSVSDLISQLNADCNRADDIFLMGPQERLIPRLRRKLSRVFAN